MHAPKNEALSISGLEGALALTEQEVLAAGERLATILSESQQQLGELSKIEGQLHLRDAGSLGAVLDDLLSFVHRAIELYQQLGQDIAHLSTRSETAHRGAAEILRLIREIQSISDSSRLLALNARIEAGRGSTHQAALAALANEMKDLSQQVTSTAATIERVGTSLASVLDDVGTCGEKAAKSCASTIVELRSRGADLQESQTQGRRAVADVLDSSRARGERIRKEYFAVLSHLQFQDVLRQRMREATEEHSRYVGLFEEIRSVLASQPETIDASWLAEKLDRLKPTEEQSDQQESGLVQFL